VRGRGTAAAIRVAGLSAAVALAAGSTTAAAGPGSGYRAHAQRLRVQAQALDTRAHAALLGLYALEARLDAARGRLATLEARRARLQARERLLAAGLAAAQRTLAISRRQLAGRLRTLYESGRPDALGVLLGAQTLDDALAKLDTLTRFADENRSVVASAAAASVRLQRLQRRLDAERRLTRAALAAAGAAERRLEAARGQRLSFVAGLREQRRLADAQVDRLLATARSVEQTSLRIERAAPAAQPVSRVTPPPAAPRAAATSSAPAGRTLRVSATGYSLGGHTATGMPVGWGVVAVDPSLIPLGTRLVVPGYGEAVAADVGSGVRGAMIDLWFPTLAQARAWGRRTVTIRIR
jgi:3D (Asp-Asp-Asp) domain-containing protein